jgi:fructokinase
MHSFAAPIDIRRRGTDLLCAGELLIDMIATDYGTLADCGTFQRFAGGSPANIAVNARRLGLSAVVAAAVGADELGDFLLDGLAASELDASLVQRTGESTSMVVLTRSRATPTPIFYRGADRGLALTPALEARLRESSILHFSCWPLSVEPARGCVRSMIAAARGQRSLVCFDPNYHPMIWADRREALSVIEAVMPQVDVIKPSEDDANRLFGPDKPDRHLRRFLDLGAGVVVMTLGKDGAAASDGAETRAYASLANEVVDTTGAGDAFWSGLYAGLVGGRSLDQSIRVGMAVSALKLACVGARIPRTSLAQIEAGLRARAGGADGVRQ